MKVSKGIVVCLAVSAISCVLQGMQAQTTTRHRAQRHALVVGWHDEFNEPGDWQPWTRPGATDIMSVSNGALRVTLGNTSHFFKEFGHYRAGVWTEFDVDLNRYPVLAVRANHFHGGSSWDAEVFEFRDKSAPNVRDVANGGSIPVPGNAEQLAADRVANSGARNTAETVFTVVQPNPNVKRGGKSHVRLQLNLSGPKHGAFADYAWARFITREEVEALRNNPTSRNVRLIEQ